ncbi:cytochrome P450 [Lentinula raphanica]|uniref:Cytochrome P450 n=1 Tax=Lentinula raphanica TaxID=153919 RepID=A0AA38U4M3_9AGAR|nr:cytochrome P450 [Lentinula raphanica]
MAISLRFFHSGDIPSVINFPAIAALLTLFILSRILTTVHKLRAVNHLPGLRPPFSPLRLPGALIPTSWWNTSLDINWLLRFSLYTNNETISIVPFLIGPPLIWTSNLSVARQIAFGNRTAFFKPRWASTAFLSWGINLVSAEGDIWRKHRRVMGPAFNNELYRLVWTQTMKTYRDLQTSEKWAEKGTVVVPVVQAITFKFALSVLASCAFGLSFQWDEPPRTSDGNLTVGEAMRTWVLKLPFKKIQQSNAAYEAMALFVKEQVIFRKGEIQDSTRKDAFSLLVKANEQEELKYKLSDDELVVCSCKIGNVFILLFSGHETTAKALAATLGLLALNQNCQDEVFEQIKEVVGYLRDPEFDDYHKLNKVLAAFFEAVRLFPSGHLMIREAGEDTVIQVPNPRGQEGATSLTVPKGQAVVIDMVGVHCNPRYYDDPTSYKPSRWHGITNDSEEFTAFSLGPRACIGRKFATTEAVCFLSMLLRDWKVMPKLDPGESKEQWKSRVLDAHVGLTLGVRDVPLCFVPRK